MILHPSIIALCIDSLLTCGILVYAAVFAFRILRNWDMSSGSELQIELEHRTCLISTIMAACLVFQVISLFLFIHTVDNLCRLFPGAMCAAGTLNLNRFGYPVLVLKLLNAICAGTWLIINHADNQGFDYPLIRVKYRMLLLITPLVLVESALLGLYFLSLHPHVITSCCGSLFSSLSADSRPMLTLIPVIPLLATSFITIVVTVILGMYSLRRQMCGYLFSGSVALTFAIGAAALVISIPVYLYALPGHHCPFCMLHREYGYVGYLLYGTLLGGAVCGLAVGMLQPFRYRPSLLVALPRIQRALVLSSLILLGFFGILSAFLSMVSELRLS